LSGGDWILTLEHSVLCHRLGGEEEKKRKKRKSNRVVACGALFGMRFVIFFIYYFFPEFVYGQQGCHMWSSIWDGICQILFIYYFFLEFVYGLSHVGLYLG
jgi:hypothetical protein